MKKSLSLLLSGAMVFGLFASAVSAAETTNLTPQQKFEELKAKGIFAGLADGSAGLDQEMTRAQAARIIALLKGLEGIGVPDTRVVTEKPFPDVELNQWFVEEVDAVKEDGSFKGNADGTFNPNGNLSVQELAVAVAAALGFDAAAADPVEIEGAASWAGSSIKFLEDNGYVVPTNYTEPATRGQLVEATYVANEILNPVEPAKVSVASAKATGVKEVTVTLDKAVDTEKATLTLKRSSTTVETTVAWSDDNKTATLTLTKSKIMDGDYSVTLAGLEEAEIENAMASFKGDNERVTKLEFTAPSDTIAQANKVRIQFQALNQYDEDTSIAAGNFQVYASTPNTVDAPTVTKDANGNLYVVLDTDDSEDENAVLIPNMSQISVNVINTDSQVSVTKIFKLGTKPYVAKVETGEVVYSNGEDYLSKQGDKAVVELIQYDQYGHRITEDSNALFNASVNVLPYLAELKAELDDDNNDDILDVVVSLETGDAKATGEYTVNVFGGTSASAKINVKATQYAATVELDAPTLAAGDVDKYITINAFDKDGNKLSAQDIVNNYESGHLQFSSSSNLTLGVSDEIGTGMLAKQGDQYAVMKTGEHKGQLHIASVGAKGYANIFVNITPSSANGIMFNHNFQFNIQEKRYPVSLSVETDNAKKAVSGAESKFKINAIDQYGDKINKEIGAIQEPTKTVTYDVYVAAVDKKGAVTFSGTLGEDEVLDNVLGKDLKFESTGAAIGDFYEVKISLRKRNATVNSDGEVTALGSVIDDSVDSVTKSMKVINPETARLTYTLSSIDTLYHAIDDKTYNSAGTDDASYDDAVNSKHAREVKVEAKDGSGDKVALPSGYVLSVTSSNPSVVATNSHDHIIGNKAGTATINVIYKKAEGGSGTLSKEVEVKADPIMVASFSGGKASAEQIADLAYAWTLMELKVKDNYNTEYKFDDFDADDGETAKDSSIATYDKLLGVRYSISEITPADPDLATGTVEVNNNAADDTADADGVFGQVRVTGNVAGYTLTATAPSGQTRVTAVTVNIP